MYCTRCGTPLRSGLRFCTGCGDAIAANEAVSTGPTPSATPSATPAVPTPAVPVQHVARTAALVGGSGGSWQVAVGPTLPVFPPRAATIGSASGMLRGGVFGILGRFGARSRWMMLVVTVASTFVMLGSGHTAGLPLAIASAAFGLLSVGSGILGRAGGRWAVLGTLAPFLFAAVQIGAVVAAIVGRADGTSVAAILPQVLAGTSALIVVVRTALRR